MNMVMTCNNFIEKSTLLVLHYNHIIKYLILSLANLFKASSCMEKVQIMHGRTSYLISIINNQYVSHNNTIKSRKENTTICVYSIFNN